MPVAAVIFDMDGVIVESEHLWELARRELVGESGGLWHDGAHAAMMGMSTPEWTSYMRETLGVPLTADEISLRILARLTQLYRSDPPLIDGAAGAVKALAERWPVAIASSSYRELIDLVADLADIERCLTARVSSAQAGRGKPAPDVFLRAAELLGADPGRCVAIEDSANGIRAALAAGMPVVVLPARDHPPPDDLLAAASAVVTSAAEITPNLIERCS